MLENSFQDHCVICFDIIINGDIPSEKFFNCKSCKDPKNDHRKLFHKNCFNKHIIYHKKCPICNNELSVNTIDEHNNFNKQNKTLTLFLLMLSVIILFILTPVIIIKIYG